MTYLLFYVADIILTISEALCKSIMSKLCSEFAIKDLAPLSYFLCISITHTSSSLFISQKRYAQKIIDRANMSACKSLLYRSTPNPNLVLQPGINTMIPLSTGVSPMLFNIYFYQPDICYVIQQFFLFMRDPQTHHMFVVKRIIRYVKDTLDFGLNLSTLSTTSLLSYILG